MRDNVSKGKEKSKASLKTITMGPGYVAQKSEKPLTIPEEFNFATDDVMKRRQATRRKSSAA
eukprot:m.320516 g.320516  ORF g.320516 m.320516 type:complete len:62 (-) comp16520_c0_seq13:694-879(-)